MHKLIFLLQVAWLHVRPAVVYGSDQKVMFYRRCVTLRAFWFPSQLTPCSFTEIEPEVAPVLAEAPEIKLFGRWSTEDVQISDISLQVKHTVPLELKPFYSFSKLFNLPMLS